MKVLVISGFLGAGKTTFIKELSRRTGKQFVLLENEYASLGLDGDRLKESSNKNTIWEMTQGCICCSKQGDFAASILTIASSLDPEYLIIEPSGVGMLSKILSHIKKVEYERIKILSPLTIVDGQSIERYKREFKEIYEDQIKTSKNILISKLENSSTDEKNKAVEVLKRINPEANIFSEHYRSLSNSAFLSFLESEDTVTVIGNNENKAENIDSLTVFDENLTHPTYLILLLEDIIRGKYGNIIRAKGSLSVDKTNLKFDLADKKYSILICEETQKNGAVFIGKDIDKRKLKRQFMKSDGESNKKINSLKIKYR